MQDKRTNLAQKYSKKGKNPSYSGFMPDFWFRFRLKLVLASVLHIFSHNIPPNCI